MPKNDEQVDLSIELELIETTQPQPIQSKSKGLTPFSYLLIAGSVLLCVSLFVTIILKVSGQLDSNRKSIKVAFKKSHEKTSQESILVFKEYIKSLHDNKKYQTDPELLAIKKMFDSLSTKVAEHSNEGIRDFIDFDYAMKRVELSGYLSRVSWYERKLIRGQMKEFVDYSEFSQEIQIVKCITPPSDTNTRIIYALCADDDKVSVPYRFCISFIDRQWKIYDWEDMHYGNSLSEHFSTICKYAGSNQLQAYFRAIEYINEADAAYQEGDYKKCETKILLAEKERVPAEFNGIRWMHVAYRWQNIGKQKEVIRSCKNVTYDDSLAGAYYKLMEDQIYSDPEDSLKYAQLYEQIIGPTPELLKHKATLFDRLKYSDRSLELRTTLLRMQPKEPQVLVDYMLAYQENESFVAHDLLQEIEKKHQINLVTSNAIQSLSYQDFEKSRILIDYVRDNSPKKPIAYYSQGILDFRQGKYEQAALLYRRAFEQETDADSKKLYVNAYLNVMLELGQIKTAITNISDAHDAVSLLLYRYEDNEITLSDEEYHYLLNWHAKKSPDDLSAQSSLVTRLLEDERYSEAESLVQTVLLNQSDSYQENTPDKKNSDSYSDEYSLNNIKSSLCIALYRQGQTREAYEVSKVDASHFERLVRAILYDNKIDLARSFLDSYAEYDSHSKETFELLLGELAMAETKWNDAISHFKAAIQASSGEQEWYLYRQLRKACTKGNQWEIYFDFLSDKEDAFSQIASALIEDENWGEFELLLTKSRLSSVPEIALQERRLAAFWKQKDFRSYAEIAVEVLKDNSDLGNYQEDLIRSRLLQALLHLDEFYQATRLANNCSSLEEKSKALAVIYAAREQSDSAILRGMKYSKQAESAYLLYHHDEAWRFFVSPQALKMQKEFPVELPYEMSSTTAVLLNEEPFDLKPNELLSKIQPIYPTAKISLLNNLSISSAISYSIMIKDQIICVSHGIGKYDARWETNSQGKIIAQDIDNHTNWLEVRVIGWTRESRDRASQIAREITLVLCDTPNQVICVPDRVSWQNYLAFTSNELACKTWKETGKLNQFDRSVFKIEAEGEITAVKAREFRQGLYKAVAARDLLFEDKMTVWTSLVDRSEAGPLRLKVSKTSWDYGEIVIQGELLENSELIPELKAGLPMQLNESEVDAWQLSDGPIVYRP